VWCVRVCVVCAVCAENSAWHECFLTSVLKVHTHVCVAVCVAVCGTVGVAVCGTSVLACDQEAYCAWE